MFKIIRVGINILIVKSGVLCFMSLIKIFYGRFVGFMVFFLLIIKSLMRFFKAFS